MCRLEVLKHAKLAQPQAKVVYPHVALVQAERSTSRGTSTAPTTQSRERGLVTQGLFFPTVPWQELALNAGSPIGHAPWERRRLAGRETGGGEKGARPFRSPLPAPSAGSSRRLVRGYYANCSDCGNKQGNRERREGCESIATSAKSRTLQSTPGKTRENLRTSSPGWIAFKREERERERDSERQSARIAFVKAFWFGVKKKKKKKFPKKPAIGQQL